jgi:hypothetical protein
MKLLTQYTERMEPDGALLYGLRGKSLINKQMNYIIDKVCEHLGWVKVEYENPENEDHNNTKGKGRRKGNKTVHKTEKYFTPHGLRYTLSTLLHEMGVSDDAIRFLLGHSKYELGALQHYILSDAKYIKEIRAAQVIIETLFETTMELETNYNITLNLEEIYVELPNVFSNQLKNKNYINLFKEHLVKYAFTALQEKYLKNQGIIILIISHLKHQNFITKLLWRSKGIFHMLQCLIISKLMECTQCRTISRNQCLCIRQLIFTRENNYPARVVISVLSRFQNMLNVSIAFFFCSKSMCVYTCVVTKLS